MHISLADLSIACSGKISPIEFYALFRQGFYIWLEESKDIIRLLHEDMQLSNAYIETRIQTVFLNHSPVDDLQAAAVKENDVLVLSGAMPGLAGAVLRRDSYYAGFRKDISHRSDVSARDKGGFLIKIKIFNILVKELAAHVLKMRPYLLKEDFWAFLQATEQKWKNADCQFQIDTGPVGDDLDSLQRALSDTDFVRLEVNAETIDFRG